MDIPENTSHVYTKQHKSTGLQPSFAGPFPIEERLSKSTIKIRVGYKVSGDPIYEVRHLNDIKLVSPGSNVEEASRPKKGRPRKQPDLPEVSQIDFTQPPPNLKPWSASQIDLQQLNHSINQKRL